MRSNGKSRMEDFTTPEAKKIIRWLSLIHSLIERRLRWNS